MIRTLLAPAALAVILAAGAPAAAEPCQGEPTGTKLDILIDGVRSDQGLMTATVYPAEAGRFLKAKGEIAVWRVPAKAPSTPMCVWLPRPGAYAVAIYDDLNGNHRFDHSAIAPQEPYGFSNDPRLFLGPPSASAARFTVEGGETTIHIRLRYPSNLSQ
jgi:uncharacterized protein (DUF2141 family)